MLCLSLAVAAPARRCITACLHRARSWLCPIRAVQQFCAFVAICIQPRCSPTVPAHRDTTVFQAWVPEDCAQEVSVPARVVPRRRAAGLFGSSAADDAAARRRYAWPLQRALYVHALAEVLADYEAEAAVEVGLTASWFSWLTI